MQMNAGKELSKNGDHPCFHQYPPRQIKNYYLISISINMTVLRAVCVDTAGACLQCVHITS